MRDLSRGWAWTRALLGIPADEIHLCGEAAAIDLVYLSYLYSAIKHKIMFKITYKIIDLLIKHYMFM